MFHTLKYRKPYNFFSKFSKFLLSILVTVSPFSSIIRAENYLKYFSNWPRIVIFYLHKLSRRLCNKNLQCTCALKHGAFIFVWFYRCKLAFGLVQNSTCLMDDEETKISRRARKQDMSEEQDSLPHKELFPKKSVTWNRVYVLMLLLFYFSD